MINLRSSLFVVALGLSAAACQKAPDLGKVQSQALLTVKSYVGTLEVLQRRADGLLAQFRTMDPNLPGANEAGRRLGDARGQLEQLRALTNGAPTAYGAAAKEGSLDVLQAAIDGTNTRLQDGVAKVTADLAAFESWAAFARPAVAVNTTPPPAAPPTDTPPADTPPAEPPPADDTIVPSGGAAPAAPAAGSASN